MLHLHNSQLIPVIIGGKIPQSDGGDQEKRLWACTMLVLFKLWRHPFDLKMPGQQWEDVFDRYRPYLSQHYMHIIRNMGVLVECKDAHDQHVSDRGSE
jgi:hypothetical protein